MCPRFHNYLVTHRKGSYFSQKQIAFMLGSKCGSNLSRLERRKRLPTLKTALALEIIFGVPVGELYAGIKEEVERSVALRAEKLAEELEQSPEDRLIDYQLEILNRITRVLK